MRRASTQSNYVAATLTRPIFEHQQIRCRQSRRDKTLAYRTSSLTCKVDLMVKLRLLHFRLSLDSMTNQVATPLWDKEHNDAQSDGLHKDMKTNGKCVVFISFS